MITMMKNNKSSVTKQSNNNKEKKQQKNKKSPRSALKVKDLNVSSSTEASSGCLSFFLSNHQTCSIVSKNGCNQSKSVTANTPKTLKISRRKLGDVNVEKNLGKPTSKIVNKLRKNSKFSSRSDLCDEISSGSELKLCDSSSVTKFGNGSGLDCCVRYDEGLKLGDGDRICADNTSPVPPVQVSVSPEIQGGSASVVPATPNTCYGAGHVLSGVSDRRKCKPRGILTIGNHDLFGSCKTKLLSNLVENVTVGSGNRKLSLVPSPTDASVHWMLSPCDEDKTEGQEEEDGSGLRLSCFESSACLSTPCSSLGFSSEVLYKSDSTMTSSHSTLASSSSSKSSRSRGVLGPSFDHFVCSPTPSSLVSMTSWKLGMSTPYSEDSIGSGNVIRTPQSNSSSPKFGLPCMSRDEISRLWFDHELDSVAEVLTRVSLSPDCQNLITDDSPKTSFEFNPLIKPASSFDFGPLRKAIDSQISAEIPDSLLPESEARMASYLFEMEELDCCRCFSDDEDNGNGCIDGSDPNMIAANLCDNINVNDEGNFTSKGFEPCQEPTGDVVGGSLPASENSGWKLRYKDKFLQG